jgi:RHS repeat-associated protein
MVETALSAPPTPAGPPVPGRSASRIASDRRGATWASPEHTVFEQLARRCFGPAGPTCIGRAWSHRGAAHRNRRRFSGQTRSGRYCRARYYHPGRRRFISEDPIEFGGGDTNLYGYVWQSPLHFRDPDGLAGREIDLGLGWTARVDSIPTHAAGPFEYHVFNPQGAEMGIAGPEGWKARHRYPGTMPEGIPRDVINRLNGQVIDDLRRAHLLPLKGGANIRHFIKRFLRPDKTSAVTACVCLVSPWACEGFDHAVACLVHGSRKPKCKPAEIPI